MKYMNHKNGGMKRGKNIFPYAIPLLISVLLLFPVLSQAAEPMPLPVGQQFLMNCPTVFPQVAAAASSARPIGIGTVATGGDTFSLKIGLQEFTGPVDIYLAVNTSFDANTLYFLKEDNSISNSAIPWKSNITAAVDQPIGEIPANSLPPGIYAFYLAVTPYNDMNSYYIWTTSFSTFPPFIVSPSCKNFVAASSQQIALVNTGADALAGSAITTSGDGNGEFKTTSNCSTVEAGGWCSLNVDFTPKTSGIKKAILKIPFSDVNNSEKKQDVYITLLGTVTGDICSSTIDHTQAPFAANGGSGSVNVTAGSSCSWTATSNVSWVTISAGSSGTGNGTVNYTVSPNNTGTARTGTLTIAGQTFTVIQAGTSSFDVCLLFPTLPQCGTTPGCSYTLSSSTTQFLYSGGSGSITVTPSSGCTGVWSLSASADWITFSQTEAQGAQTVSFSIAQNPGTAKRTGTISLWQPNGNSVAITQDGNPGGTTTCSYSLAPTSSQPSSAAGSFSITVTAPAGCSWTASTSDTWISITSGNSGTGNGTVNYSVLANTGGARTGMITIAGQSFTVSQSCGDGCTNPPPPSGTYTPLTVNVPLMPDAGGNVRARDPNGTTPPNYGRSAKFFKFTIPDGGCPGGNPAQVWLGGYYEQLNSDMIVSNQDMTPEQWWSAYFDAEKRGYIAGPLVWANISPSAESENISIYSPVGTYYIMVVGEDVIGTKGQNTSYWRLSALCL